MSGARTLVILLLGLALFASTVRAGELSLLFYLVHGSKLSDFSGDTQNDGVIRFYQLPEDQLVLEAEPRNLTEAFNVNLAEGAYRVEIWITGFVRTSKLLNLGPDRRTVAVGLDISLEDGYGTVAGKVIGAQPGTWVRLTSLLQGRIRQRFVKNTSIGEDGLFQFSSLPTGSWTLVVLSPTQSGNSFRVVHSEVVQSRIRNVPMEIVIDGE